MKDPRTTFAAYTGPRTDVAALVSPTAKRVLDVGCAQGALGESLRARGAEVWGVECDPDFAATAATRLNRVEVGDAGEVVERLVGCEPFDVVVCADVLEHLVDPLRALRGAARLLSETGRCVVSLPNVRFYTTFTELGLRGRWPRRDRGVHDRTHISWFTDTDARELFLSAGLVVENSVTHYRLLDNPQSRLNRIARFVAVGPIRPFLAYQYLYRLRKQGAVAGD